MLGDKAYLRHLSLNLHEKQLHQEENFINRYLISYRKDFSILSFCLFILFMGKTRDLFKKLERLEISSRKLEIQREHFIQRWAP